MFKHEYDLKFMLSSVKNDDGNDGLTVRTAGGAGGCAPENDRVAIVGRSLGYGERAVSEYREAVRRSVEQGTSRGKEGGLAACRPRGAIWAAG